MKRKVTYVYQKKNGSWEGRYVKEIDINGKKKYGSVYGKTRKEAQEKRQEAMDQILLYQKPIVTRKLTIAQLMDEWLHINQAKLKPTTLERYRSLNRRHIEPILGKQPALYFTTKTIHDFTLNRLNYGLAPTTVNGILVLLHSALQYGHRQYRLPMPEIVYLPSQKKEMRVLSIQEQKQLVAYLTEDIDVHKFGVLLALYTGLRIGELCGLQWEDIDRKCIKVRRTLQRIKNPTTEKNEIHIGPPKTNASIRDIPIPSFLNKYMEQFREARGSCQYVLGTSKFPITEPRTMQNKLKKYLDTAGVQKANFHALRHSFATRCIEIGFDVKTLSEILGHTSVQTTLNRYVHSSFELKSQNMEKLNTFLV